MPAIKTSFRICELFGIPLYIDLTTILLVVLIVSRVGSLVYGLGLSLVLIISIVLHELGHSLMGRLFGGHTEYIELRLIGGAAVGDIPRKAWHEFLVAAAGPLVSFALCGILIVVEAVFDFDNFIGAMVYGGALVNLTLGLFNLLPGFPMDGGRMFRSLARLFLSRVKATYIAMIVGRVSAVALVVLPFFGINYIWIIPIGGDFFMRLLIAFMIWREGYREYVIARMESSWRS